MSGPKSTVRSIMEADRRETGHQTLLTTGFAVVV